MRISTRSLYDSIANAIAQGQQRVMKLQQNLGDGRAVRAPSDDPVRAHAAMWFRERIRASEQYERNIDGVLSHLSATETALAQIQDVVGELMTLQTSGADDALGADGRTALATRVDHLMEMLVEIGNARHAGAFLLGGTRTLEAPLVPVRDAGGRIEGVDFNPRGIDGEIRRMVGLDVSLSINVRASDVFGKDGSVFDGLASLREALEGNDGEKVRGLAGMLEEAQDLAALAATTAGSLITRAEAMRDRAMEDSLAYEDNRSRAEDLPAARAVVDFTAAKVALEAALASGARIMNLSLLDYLY